MIPLCIPYPAELLNPAIWNPNTPNHKHNLKCLGFFFFSVLLVHKTEVPSLSTVTSHCFLAVHKLQPQFYLEGVCLLKVVWCFCKLVIWGLALSKCHVWISKVVEMMCTCHVCLHAARTAVGWQELFPAASCLKASAEKSWRRSLVTWY